MSQFVDVIKETTLLGKYASNKPRIMEMLLEVNKRIPWQRYITNSLLKQIRNKGRLSPKQESLITSLYIDSCVISDATIRRQVECRNTCNRLRKCRLGHTSKFIDSVYQQTFQRQFSPAQMRAIDNISLAKAHELYQVVNNKEDNLVPDSWDAEFWG